MKIDIKGPIISDDDQFIYDYFGISATSPKYVTKQIDDAKGEDLEIEINSGGGDVYAGNEIYTAIKSYKGNSVSRIVGIAASAASYIAIAAKKVTMSPVAQFMIHNVSSVTWGDNRDMAHESTVLKSHDESIANAYMLKTGKSRKELLDMMGNETFLNAKDALKEKFIDEIMFDDKKQLVASIKGEILPPEVIEKTRIILNQKKIDEQTANESKVDQSEQTNSNPEVLTDLNDEKSLESYNKKIISNERRKNQ
jgi:ATP-dependent Clp protease protease subunit